MIQARIDWKTFAITLVIVMQVGPLVEYVKSGNSVAEGLVYAMAATGPTVLIAYFITWLLARLGSRTVT